MRLQNTMEKQSETRELLEENLKYTKEILRISRKTKKYLFWMQIAGWAKILLIAVPLIVGIIYLPPLITQWQNQIKEALEPIDAGNKAIQEIQKNNSILDLIKTFTP